MARESKYFPLSLESLRTVGSWATDCAERALSVYEAQADSDSRPRAAIEGIRMFAGGGKRTARLRTLALSAHSAAREAGDPAAIAAARAAYKALDNRMKVYERIAGSALKQRPDLAKKIKVVVK